MGTFVTNLHVRDAGTHLLLRLLHPERIVLEQLPSKRTDLQAKMKDAVLKKLRQSYPAFAAKMPNPPIE